MKHPRLDYNESIRRLQELGWLEREENPPLPNGVPQPEDEEPLGLSFFRTFVGDSADLGDLSIPRTFFGRSEIRDVSFQNADLTESNLRWNDFIDVDFTDAVLVRADLRASIYSRVDFTGADLRGADLRRSEFKQCVFTDALMDGAVITRAGAARLGLTKGQLSVLDYRDDDGPEPSGG